MFVLRLGLGYNQIGEEPEVGLKRVSIFIQLIQARIGALLCPVQPQISHQLTISCAPLL